MSSDEPLDAEALSRRVMSLPHEPQLPANVVANLMALHNALKWIFSVFGLGIFAVVGIGISDHYGLTYVVEAVQKMETTVSSDHEALVAAAALQKWKDENHEGNK